jgi:hypothetical protein
MPHIVRPRQVSSTAVGRGAGSQYRGPAEDLSAKVEPVRSAARTQHLALSVKQLAEVAVATLLVAGCPVAAVWWLRASGAVSSAVVGLVFGMALSLGASYVGCLVWEKRPGSEDLLFSELMIWGYLHRWRTQRRLASALDMLGTMWPDPVGSVRLV